MIKYPVIDDKCSLEHRITKYVNDNLKIMLDVYIDYLNEQNGYELSEKLIEVLPRDYVARKPDECRRLIDELYEIIVSPVIRDYIKPKYEYILYHVIYAWKESCGNDYIPIELDTNLREEISSCKEFIEDETGSNGILNDLEDFDRFLNSCFYDTDFLVDDLSSLVSLYLDVPDAFLATFSDVNLDEYLDLMPVDLRELYINKKQKDLLQDNLKEESFNKLLKTIIKACVQMQGNVLYRSVSENKRNTFISSSLEMAGYYVKDQTLWGKSSEGKESGEIDIFVRDNNKNPLSIIEALNLDSLKKDYINSHLIKIWGYDANGLKHNVIIVYYKAKRFVNFWKKYVDYLKNIEYPYEFIEFVESKNERFSEIRHGIALHMRNEKKVYLHHIVINMEE